VIMNTVRKLPIGIQDFEKLRKGNNVYVDKTMHIYKLLQSDAPYFLGRPRRFGKSLFLSTLKAFFEGKKELFEGLKIAELEKDWIKYPVIYIDFNVGLFINAENVSERIKEMMDELKVLWSINKESGSIPSLFQKIIRAAYEQTGKPVVVLIDEYDKPLINTMDNKEENEKIKLILKSFYGVLKSNDAYLRFVFLTGVTKFSKVSVFSDLNQLVDISLNEEIDLDMVKAGKYDAVILAAGGRPAVPEFLKKANDCISAWDAVEGKKRAGVNTVIVGGGLVGCETADFLIHPFNDLNERSRKVTIIEMDNMIGRDDKSSFRPLLVKRLLEKGCNIITSAKVISASGSTLEYEKGNKKYSIENIDTVVAAVGIIRENKLEADLKAAGMEVFVIGDAASAGNIHAATSAAYEAAMKL